jgi:hypothetical protein
MSPAFSPMFPSDSLIKQVPEFQSQYGSGARDLELGTVGAGGIQIRTQKETVRHIDFDEQSDPTEIASTKIDATNFSVN